MGTRYTKEEVFKLLRKVPRDEESGRMSFQELQKVVLENQKKRLRVLVARIEGGKPVCPPKENKIKVPFQSKSAAHLMEVPKKLQDKPKKYVSPMEEIVGDIKRAHSYCTLVAPLEQQNMGRQLKANT